MRLQAIAARPKPIGPVFGVSFPGLGDGASIELLIHEEASGEQTIKLRFDLNQKTSILGCQEQSDGSNYGKAQ